MFPRKQYKSRNKGGYIEDINTPIYISYAKNMPYGSVTYPYKEHDKYWADAGRDDIFAIYTQVGWRFFQADRENGNIFKMWRFSGVEACPGCKDGSKVRPLRYAYHLNQKTLSGKIFMQEMTMGDDDYEKRYLSVNALPIQYAYYDYDSTYTENTRNKICEYNIEDNDENDWSYTLYLTPHIYEYGVDDNKRGIKIDIIRNIHFEIKPSDDYINYTGEYATRIMDGPLGDGKNNVITTAWGEYGGNDDEITKHQYFYIEVSDKDDNEGMVYTQSSLNMSIYDKSGENANYSRLLHIIKHDKDNDNYVVLETCEGDNNSNKDIVNRCLFQSHKDKDADNDIEYIKTSLGGLILQDDVTVFLFDSCEDDEERLLIRNTLMKKYSMQIKYGDSLKTYNEPILSYIPDLDLMDPSDDICKTIIENCICKK